MARHEKHATETKIFVWRRSDDWLNGQRLRVSCESMNLLFLVLLFPFEWLLLLLLLMLLISLLLQPASGCLVGFSRSERSEVTQFLTLFS